VLGLGCARVRVCKGYGVQGLGLLWCGRVRACKAKRRRNHRQKDTPATKLVFCVMLFSKSLFFMTTHYIDVHIL
jgi:hypothetical protein